MYWNYSTLEWFAFSLDHYCFVFCFASMYYLCARHVIDMTMSIFVFALFQMNEKKKKNCYRLNSHCLQSIILFCAREWQRTIIPDARLFRAISCKLLQRTQNATTIKLNRNLLTGIVSVLFFWLLFLRVRDFNLRRSIYSNLYRRQRMEYWNIILTCNMNNLYTSFFFVFIYVVSSSCRLCLSLDAPTAYISIDGCKFSH